MDELDSLFTIDRCGNEDKCDRVPKSKLEDKKAILYKCNSDLLELKSADEKLHRQRSHIPKHCNKRLHEAANDSSNIRPGKLSDKLRRALGLSTYGLPLHIYRMRYLGYPPGWLRQIETKPSELKFIGDDSKIRRENSVEYRTDELIEYPGFNTLINYDPEEDHWQELGMIAMREEHSMEVFSKALQSGSMKSTLSFPLSHLHLNDGIDTLEQHRQTILAEIRDIDTS